MSDPLNIAFHNTIYILETSPLVSYITFRAE